MMDSLIEQGYIVWSIELIILDQKEDLQCGESHLECRHRHNVVSTSAGRGGLQTTSDFVLVEWWW
jgi:hypothetical protein